MGAELISHLQLGSLALEKIGYLVVGVRNEGMRNFDNGGVKGEESDKVVIWGKVI